jgi:hypothetical protein
MGPPLTPCCCCCWWLHCRAGICSWPTLHPHAWLLLLLLLEGLGHVLHDHCCWPDLFRWEQALDEPWCLEGPPASDPGVHILKEIVRMTCTHAIPTEKVEWGTPYVVSIMLITLVVRWMVCSASVLPFMSQALFKPEPVTEQVQ